MLMAVVDCQCHLLPVTFFILAALVLTTYGKFTCDTGQFKTGVVQCYQNQGLRDDAIFASFLSSAEQDVTTLLASLLATNGTEICNDTRTKQSYKNAVNCVYQQVRNCQSQLTRDIVANPDDAAKMVNPLCDNRQDIDFHCVTSKSLQLQTCERQRLDDFEDPVVYLYSGRCHVTNASAYCIKKEYKACGCGTSKTYSDIIYDLLQPTECIDQNSTEYRVVCQDGNRRAFVSDGLNHGRKTIMTSLVYVLPLVALRFCNFVS